MTPYYIIAALAAVIVIMILWQWRHQRLLSLRAQLMREALATMTSPSAFPRTDCLPESATSSRRLTTRAWR